MSNCASAMQISEIKIADIPDIDLTRIGVSKYGNFTVEVIDPVADYVELLEVRCWLYLSSVSLLHVVYYNLFIYSCLVTCAECF